LSVGNKFGKIYVFNLNSYFQSLTQCNILFESKKMIENMENEEKQRYLSSYQQYLTDKNKNVNIQNNEKENKENIFEIENMAPQNQQSLNAKHKKKPI